jgi:hypothetical protein
VAAVEADPLAILKTDKDIEQYHWELKSIINLLKEIQVIHTDNMDYT